MGRKKDITGQRFGKLIAIEPTNERKNNGEIVWMCLCDCGRMTKASQSVLRKGEKQRCEHCKENKFYLVMEIEQRNKPDAFKVMLDVEDYDKVKQYKWFVAQGYIRTKVNDKSFPMHRLLLDFPKSGIDHIDQNKANNTKNNLRLCNQKQNSANTGLFAHNTSGYKGVTWDKNREMFMAKIKIDQKTVNLGRYKTPQEAAMAYNERAKIAFGKFARLNNVGDVSGYNIIK